MLVAAQHAVARHGGGPGYMDGADESFL